MVSPNTSHHFTGNKEGSQPWLPSFPQGFSNVFRSYRLDNSGLGDDRTNQFRRGYIEGGVVNIHMGGGCSFAESANDFLGRSFLNRDLGSVFDSQVKTAGWSNYVEGYIVEFGQNRHRVSAYFVGGVSIGCNAIRTYQYRLNFAQTHYHGCHVVAKESYRYACLLELPCCKTGALKQRTGFVGKYLNIFFARWAA